MKKSAIAIFAHPDDVEFMAAGTMILLAKAGYELHYFLLCSGNCGAVSLGPNEIRGVREAEARKAAEIIGAEFHPCISDDLELVYSVENLRKVTAVIRHAHPEIVLTHSPQDYMEDHMIASRLAVSAASLPLWRRWCLRVGLMDAPGHRKIHDTPVPLAGGLTEMTGLALPILAASLWSALVLSVLVVFRAEVRLVTSFIDLRHAKNQVLD